MTDEIVWQFDLAWALAELPLSELTSDELTKNIAEIGQLRLMRAAGAQVYLLASI